MKAKAMRQVEEVHDVSGQIRPLLAGRNPEIVGAVLGDLLATLLAGHILKNDDGSIARGPTGDLREQLLDDHIRVVRELIPLCEREILGHSEARA